MKPLFGLLIFTPLLWIVDAVSVSTRIHFCDSITRVSSSIFLSNPRYPCISPLKYTKMSVWKDAALSVSFGCHCFYVGVHFLHLLGLSSSSPYQSSPIPTHCYRDVGYWNHHHWDHQASGRGTLWHSLRVLHPQNHLPPWSAWDSERLDKLFIPDTEETKCLKPKKMKALGYQEKTMVIVERLQWTYLNKTK